MPRTHIRGREVALGTNLVGAATLIHTWVLLHYAPKYENQNPCWSYLLTFLTSGSCVTLLLPIFCTAHTTVKETTAAISPARNKNHLSHKSALHVCLPTCYPDRKRHSTQSTMLTTGTVTQHTIQPNITPKPHTRQT